MPGIQVKIVPVTLQFPVRVEEAPLQIPDGDAVAEITRLGLTVTVTEALPLHPDAPPDAVYVVVTAGVTVTGVPVAPPGCQVISAPGTLLVSVSVVEFPAHIVEGLAKGVITRLGLTITVTEVEAVHPNELPVIE